MCTVFPINKHPPTRNPPNDINRPTRNPPKRHQLPTRNLSKRNCRGGAYVPARTFAQRRFHTKNRFVYHVSCAENERRMRPCRATRAGTQAPPLPNSIIFSHTILHKQKNHLHAIRPKETNRPCAIRPNDINRPARNPPKRHQLPTRYLLKRNRRGGAYVPARTSA